MRISHDLVISDDLYTHFAVSLGGVARTDHVTEDTLAGVTVNLVLLVQNLTNTYSWKITGMTRNFLESHTNNRIQNLRSKS